MIGTWHQSASGAVSPCLIFLKVARLDSSHRWISKARLFGLRNTAGALRWCTQAGSLCLCLGTSASVRQHLPTRIHAKGSVSQHTNIIAYFFPDSLSIRLLAVVVDETERRHSR